MATETANSTVALMVWHERDWEALEDIFQTLDPDQLAHVDTGSSHELVQPLASWEEAGLEI